MQRISPEVTAGAGRAGFGGIRAGVRRFVVTRLEDGSYSVEGAGPGAAPRFALLSEAVSFARESCAAAAATVELRLGEVMATIRQARGWPQAICGEPSGTRGRPL